MPINHLLRNLENRERRTGDSRPTWLVELIDQAADLFEPLRSVSRVGFDCWPTEKDWMVFLFLGDTEIVGGRDDGRLDPLEFRFDLLGLLDLLEDVQQIQWMVLPVGNDPSDNDRSYISIVAHYQGHPVSLRLLSIAPENAGPGLRLFPNGDCQPT